MFPISFYVDERKMVGVRETTVSHNHYALKGGYFMTDKEQIIADLGKSSIAVEEQKRLCSICDAIFAAYDEGSRKAVSDFLQGKINPIKDKFDEAHTKLLKKMGL